MNKRMNQHQVKQEQEQEQEQETSEILRELAKPKTWARCLRKYWLYHTLYAISLIGIGLAMINLGVRI